MIRILIADRHACTRAGYRSYLSGSLRGAHVGEAVTSGDVLKQLVENAWDLLMLDVEFVAQSNFRLLEEVRSVRPTMRILVTSGLSDAQWERPLLLAGVDGYLSKARSRRDVLDMVGGTLSRRVSERQILPPRGCDTPRRESDSQSLHDCLSLREFQILCQLALGRRLSDMASQLSISVKTVSTYRVRLLRKMGLTRNAELTHYALRNGLIAYAPLGEDDWDQLAPRTRARAALQIPRPIHINRAAFTLGESVSGGGPLDRRPHVVVR